MTTTSPYNASPTTANTNPNPTVTTTNHAIANNYNKQDLYMYYFYL